MTWLLYLAPYLWSIAVAYVLLDLRVEKSMGMNRWVASACLFPALLSVPSSALTSLASRGAAGVPAACVAATAEQLLWTVGRTGADGSARRFSLGGNAVSRLFDRRIIQIADSAESLKRDRTVKRLLKRADPEVPAGHRIFTDLLRLLNDGDVRTKTPVGELRGEVRRLVSDDAPLEVRLDTVLSIMYREGLYDHARKSIRRGGRKRRAPALPPPQQAPDVPPSPQTSPRRRRGPSD